MWLGCSGQEIDGKQVSSESERDLKWTVWWSAWRLFLVRLPFRNNHSRSCTDGIIGIESGDVEANWGLS